MTKGGETNDFLQLIIDSIDTIISYSARLDKKQFLSDVMIQDAVVRRIAIVGECIKSLPSRLRNHYDDIDWFQLVGVRDIVIHDYWGLDYGLVYDFITNYLPVLKRQIVDVKDSYRM